MTDTVLENKRRGFWLRMSRERAGISQSTAAEELGLSGQSKSTLSAWEAGTREPRPSMLTRMALLYGVPVERLANPAPTAYEQIDLWFRSTDNAPVESQLKQRRRLVAEQVAEIAARSGVEEGIRRARSPEPTATEPASPSLGRRARGSPEGAPLPRDRS